MDVRLHLLYYFQKNSNVSDFGCLFLLGQKFFSNNLLDAESCTLLSWSTHFSTVGTVFP